MSHSFFRQVLNPEIEKHGLTPELFDQTVVFLQEFVDEIMEIVFLLLKNRGFFQKTIRPIVSRIWGPQSFLYRNVYFFKQFFLCSFIMKKSFYMQMLKVYRNEFIHRIHDKNFLADCRSVLTERHNYFYHDGCGMVWIDHYGNHQKLFRREPN